ncbi:MAG: hypothetical protein R3Y32_08845 [Bacillota bacterium]
MKNRILRSVVVVILVLTMVLTMAACESETVPSTTAPTVTPAPSTEAPEVPETEAPAETETPDVVVDTTEEELAKLGITFPTFDSLEYTTDGDDIKDSMSFGAKVDTDNIYQQAYEVSIKAVITGVTHDGSSISSTKLLNETFTDFGTSKTNNWDGESSKIYFTARSAGVYTVVYTIEVEHDKNESYGFYTPGEVDEEYTITKTYTVEKAELELKTSSDAFRVEDKMFFVDSTISNSTNTAFKDAGYSASVNVTAINGTEVGEFKLAITITNKSGDAVNADEIELDNYYVSVSEGTRYILSEEDIAKVNAIRTMANIDNGQYTTEYSLETIMYYNTLSAGQKQMAKVSSVAGNKYYDGIIVASKAVSSSDIEKAQYNMERDSLIDPVEDAIDAYITASTSTKKASALKSLCELLLNIDNTAHEYGSDLLYVLGSLTSSFDIDTAVDGEVFSVVETATSGNVNVVTFAVQYDSDDEVYSATFGYQLDDNTSVVNDVYDQYVTDYFDILEDLFYVSADENGYYLEVVKDQSITQKQIDSLKEAMADLVSAYNALIPFQLELDLPVDGDVDYSAQITGSDDIEGAHATMVDASNQILARWTAYIELIEAYGFDETYIDNADKEDLGATYAMIQSLLGYSFKNSALGSEIVSATLESDIEDINKTALSNMLFAVDGKFEVPELFVEGMIEATEAMLQVTLAVQAEVNSLRTDLIQYLVNSGQYEALYADTATDASIFETLLENILGGDLNVAYTAAAGATLKDAEGAMVAEKLADFYAYIDGVVAGEMLNPSSSFRKEYTKNGLDEAISDLFEDITKDVTTALDDLIEIEDEKD